jgi:hypothetical protein
VAANAAIARFCSASRERSAYSGAESTPRFSLAERKARSLEAAAPLARSDFGDGNRVGAEDLSEAPGLLPAFGGQIALGRAVVQSESGRVPGAGSGDGMTNKQHIAAFFEPIPERVVAKCRARPQDRGE